MTAIRSKYTAVGRKEIVMFFPDVGRYRIPCHRSRLGHYFHWEPNAPCLLFPLLIRSTRR